MINIDDIDFYDLLKDHTEIDLEGFFNHVQRNGLPETLYRYAYNVIKGRWPEAEPYIMKDYIWAYCYALDVIGGRWPEAEPYIMKNPTWAYWYAFDIIKGRWTEAEPYIKQDHYWWFGYKKLIN
jgi:hypothetical protein